MRIITSVTYISDYKLLLLFDDDSTRLIDLAGELDGEIFEPLKDIDYFRRVRVHPDLATIVWENGADMCPDFLYRNSVEVSRRALIA